MAFSANYQDLVAFLLALARTLAWMLVVPPFSNRKAIPTMATVASASGLSLLLARDVPATQIPSSAASLVGAVVVQVGTGLAIGFVVFMLLSALTSAGAFVDLMGGLNLPPSIDPLSMDQTPILGQLYEQVTLMLLFTSGGYIMMVDGFARSFQAPPISLGSLSQLARVLTIDFATYFVSALEIAAPLLAMLFATQVVLAMLTKAAPQMNVWVVGMPIQIFLAIVLVTVGLGVLPEFLGNALTRALGDSLRLFGG